MGRGKTMVEFFSLEMVARVCRYLKEGKGELREGLKGRGVLIIKGCKRQYKSALVQECTCCTQPVAT